MRIPRAGEMANTPQQFCLRWNNHQSNIVSVFEQLLHTEAFVDVTLAVEGMSLKAHKVVLSACSPYFQAVLASHPDKHPIVILKDVRYVDMRDLLDFMYRGEVSVDQDNLSCFLRVAESLRIKGLTEVNEKKRLESSTLLLSGAIAGSGIVSSISSPPASLKRPPMSPTGGSFSNKRRRGRPPKISGEESEGEHQNTIMTDGEDSRTDSEAKEIKIENHDLKEEASDDVREGESRTCESAGPSGELHGKDELKLPKEEPDHHTRESPGSGQTHINNHEWSIPSSEYDPEVTRVDTSLLLPPTPHPHSLHLPPKAHVHPQPILHHPPPTVTDIDQLYYTKNLLEAAMLKNPYEALKNDKNLHGSILLASLRAPLKFGFQYTDRELLERDLLIDSSPHPSIPPKVPKLTSPGGERSHNSSGGVSTNGKGVTVPIMSYCIQDNGFKCSKCFQTFTHPSNFHRHYITVHTDRRAHKCHVCAKEFKRKDNMMSHIRSVHRPGKEGHSIFRDSPILSRDVSPLQEQILQHVDKV